MAKKYVVALMAAERDSLEADARRGSASAAAEARAGAAGGGRGGQRRGRRREGAAERGHGGAAAPPLRRGGLEAALGERPRPGAARALDGKQEAHLVALACTAPAGRKALDDATPRGQAGGVRRGGARQLTRRCGGRSKGGEALAAQAVVPADGGRGVRGGDGGCARPVRGAVRPAEPVVCFDELPYQLVSETRAPQPPRRGRGRRLRLRVQARGDGQPVHRLRAQGGPPPGRRDRPAHRGRFRRADAPPGGRGLSPRAAGAGGAGQPPAPTPGGARRRSPAAEARRILRRLEFHYTPKKHGSWLNQAGVEWSVLGGQCLDRRIGDVETLTREVAAWGAQDRNAAKATVALALHHASDARTKLARLYAIIVATD